MNKTKNALKNIYLFIFCPTKETNGKVNDENTYAFLKFRIRFESLTPFIYVYVPVSMFYIITPGDDDHHLEPCTETRDHRAIFYTAYNVTRVTRRYSISKNTYRCDFVVQTVPLWVFFSGQLLFVDQKHPYSRRCDITCNNRIVVKTLRCTGMDKMYDFHFLCKIK